MNISLFTITKILTWFHFAFGHYLKDVYQAARKASSGHSYSSNYNCNHWTQNFASYLGHNITVHWNCSCVL